MADSPSHRLGELIGDFFEASIINYLKPIVTDKGYYLDFRHPRPARNNKREVIGIDSNGNKHKLDIVVEEGGSEQQFGRYKAFIEMAWRRYTKHSKNKVQEISGAIIPLVNTNEKEIPFYAAVLAGEFTQSSIVQLNSQGFFVIYINYENLCELFDDIGISIRWEESTSESELATMVTSLEAILGDPHKYNVLQRKFNRMFAAPLKELSTALCKSLDTKITEIIVVPIHGSAYIPSSVIDAVDYIMNYDENSLAPILRYEITIKYSNDVEYTMKCKDRRTAIQFLNQYKDS